MSLAPSSFRASVSKTTLAQFAPEGTLPEGSSGGTVLLAAYQAVPPAPGREATATQAPAPAPSGGTHPPDAGVGGGILPMLALIVPMLLLLFFTSRSQQKKQAAVIAGLKKGDRVLTQSGFAGRLVELGDRFAKLEIAPGVKVEVLKTQILGVDSAETQASAEKK